MARTRTQWETIIAGALPAASTSSVAEWKLFRDMVITITMLFESILEIFKSDVTAYIDGKQPGSVQWYRSICLQFQNGDSLQVVNGIVGYATINPANQIIKLVSVKEKDEEVLSIKVCKQVSGVNTALSGGELTNFKNYIKARKFPGTKTAVYSNSSDTVAWQLTGTYDPMVDYTTLCNNIYAALAAFMDSLSFEDGMLYYSKLYDAINDVTGMLSVNLTVNLSLSDGTSVSGFTGAIELPAGYFNYDSLSSSNIISLTPAP